MKTKIRITTEEARLMSVQLSINWSRFDVNQFRIGMEVKLEHGTVSPLTNVTDDNLLTTGKIAPAHLNEFSDYYTRILKMEKEAEQQASGK